MKFLLLLVSALAAQKMPAGAVSLGAGLKVSGSVKGKQAVYVIEKSKAGHASIGFGTTMAKGDVVVLEPTGGKLKGTECVLSGYDKPVCTPLSRWALLEQTVRPDGSWIATVARDSSKPGVLAVSLSQNPMMYSYSDSPVLADHTGPGAEKGSAVIKLNAGRRLLFKFDREGRY